LAKPFFVTVLIFLVVTLGLLSFEQLAAADDMQDIANCNVTAIIHIKSPSDNESYTGNVLLNVDVEFIAGFLTNISLPYHSITCTYQLDNGQWKNTGLIYVSGQTLFWDWINRIYWVSMNCSYCATMQNLPDGLHSINVKMQPNTVNSMDYNTYTNDSELFHYANSPVNFYVNGNYDKPTPTPFSDNQSITVPTPTSSYQTNTSTDQSNFETPLIVGSTITCTTIAIILVIALRKLRLQK
jgi:hypothetical protein